MRRPDLERLLTDDSHRRLSRIRAAATEWGHAEGNADIAVDCLLITPHGLMYAAALRGPSRRPSLPVPVQRQPMVNQPATFYYVAMPHAMFESAAERLAAERLAAARPQSAVAAAVDSRFGHDLVFTCPLDGALRRTLDANEVLHLEL
jgi:hypothetical protein